MPLEAPHPSSDDSSLDLSAGSLHEREDASSTETEEGAQHDCSTCGRTCTAGQEPRHLAPARRAAANLVAEELDIFLSQRRGVTTKWAERLGLARQVVSRFREEGGARITLGDILVLKPEQASSFLEQLLARLRGASDPKPTPPPQEGLERLARFLGIDLGQFLTVLDHALTDDHIEPAEQQAIERALNVVQSRLNDIRRKAAAEAGRPHLKEVPRG